MVDLVCREIDNAADRITSEAGWDRLTQFFIDKLATRNSLWALQIEQWAGAGHPAADKALRLYAYDETQHGRDGALLLNVKNYDSSAGAAVPAISARAACRPAPHAGRLVADGHSERGRWHRPCADAIGLANRAGVGGLLRRPGAEKARTPNHRARGQSNLLGAWEACAGLGSVDAGARVNYDGIAKFRASRCRRGIIRRATVYHQINYLFGDDAASRMPIIRNRPIESPVHGAPDARPGVPIMIPPNGRAGAAPAATGSNAIAKHRAPADTRPARPAQLLLPIRPPSREEGRL